MRVTAPHGICPRKLGRFTTSRGREIRSAEPGRWPCRPGQASRPARSWRTTQPGSWWEWSAPRRSRPNNCPRRLEMPKASQSVTVVIPARYGSSRFPGKPLVELNGKPMIQHVYQRAVACRAVSDALVATDDERIKQAVERFGGRVIMVTGDYRTGTDRVAAVARMFAGEYFLDLQGDEIPLNPELLTDLIEPFLESGAGMGTLKRVMDPTEDLLNSAVVKVVT